MTSTSAIATAPPLAVTGSDDVPRPTWLAQATSAPGITDLLVDGRTGLLSKPGDADGLAESIGMLARDSALRAKLGSAGRQRAVRDFSIEANVAAHEALYERVAATRRRRT